MTLKKHSLLSMFTAAIILCLGSELALAQGNRGGMEDSRGHPPRPDQIASMLKLDDQQRYEFQRVMQIQREKFHSFIENHKNETKEELSSVLSAEQIEKYESIMSQYEPKRRDRRGPPPRDNGYQGSGTGSDYEQQPTDRQFRFSE